MRLGSKRVIAGEIVLRALVALVVALVLPDIFSNDVNTYFERAYNIGIDVLPYRDFLWEYPPFGALPLALIPITGHNHDLFVMLFVALMVVLEYASLVLLRRARPSAAVPMTKLWMASVLPLATIGWFRLDFVAVIFATLALIGMVKGRSYAAATVAGFGVKLWPLVFGVAMLLQRRWRDAVVTAIAGSALVGVWWAVSPDGFRTFLEYRAGSGGFQVESLPGALLLASGRPHSLAFGAVTVSDTGFEWVQWLLQAVFVATPLAALALAWRRRNVNIVALLGALVCVMLVSNRLLSPQFLVWLAPFIVWLWPQQRRIGWIFAVAAWLTVTVIYLYSSYLAANPAVVGLGIARNVLLIWLTVELFRTAFLRRAPA